MPFNDLDGMLEAIAVGDAACVIMETIPATYGFPMPLPGYLQAIKKACEKVGTLYIADEVQTGLDAYGRNVGHRDLWRRAGYAGDGKGTVGRHLPDRGSRGE